MAGQPLVCVIMPVYNGSKTIKMALKSLVLQTYTNWLCVIVNDGSTDETASVLDALEDKRFKIIHLKENKGRGNARQVALENAEGTYLAYLDADDFYHPEKLQKQVDVLETDKDIMLVGCRTLTYGNELEPISTRGRGSKQPITFAKGDKFSLVVPTAMIRLGDARKYTYNANLNAAEDVDYFSKYLDNTCYSNLPDILFYYFVGDTSYRKILEYTGYSIIRGCHMLRENRAAAIRIIFEFSYKWLIYWVAIPILGIDFFMNRRGQQPTEVEIAEFESEKKRINSFNAI